MPKKHFSFNLKDKKSSEVQLINPCKKKKKKNSQD